MKTKLTTIFTLVFCLSFFMSNAQKIDSIKQGIEKAVDPVEKGEAHYQLLREIINTDSDNYVESYETAIKFASESEQRELTFKYAILDLKRERKLGNTEIVATKADSLLGLLGAEELLPMHAELHSVKGSAFGDVQEYAKAASSYFDKVDALKKYSEDPKDFALVYHAIGWALMNSKNYIKALEYFDTSLEYQEKFATHFRPNTYWNMGICYMERFELEAALEVLNLGVDEALQTGNADAAAGCQTCIASVYVRQDDYIRGLGAYKKAHQMSIDAGQPGFKVIEALNGIIYSYNQLADPFKAIPYIAQADSIIDVNEYSEIRTRQYLFQKTNNLLQRGLPQAADEVFIKYEAAYDTLRERRNQATIQEKETEFRTKEKEQELLLRNEELKNQRVITIALSLGALLLGLLGFLFIRHQRNKINLQQQEQKLNDVLHKIETKSKLEEQRDRISKELHDNIGSQLTYISSSAQNIGLALKSNKDIPIQEKLDQLSIFSSEAIADLRDTIWVMNYTSVDWETLKERIQYLAHKVTSTTNIQVAVEQIGTSERFLKPEDTLNIFRIIQESVNNAVKHSEASLITVRLTVSPEAQIVIEDNGKGFDKQKLTGASTGLSSLKSRAERLAGALDIDTSNEGTKVSLKLPELVTHIPEMIEV